LQKRLLNDLCEPILDLPTPFFKALDLKQFQSLTLKYWQIYQQVGEQVLVTKDNNLERICQLVEFGIMQDNVMSNNQGVFRDIKVGNILVD
jgi:hypothetical protein